MFMSMTLDKWPNFPKSQCSHIENKENICTFQIEQLWRLVFNAWKTLITMLGTKWVNTQYKLIIIILGCEKISFTQSLTNTPWKEWSQDSLSCQLFGIFHYSQESLYLFLVLTFFYCHFITSSNFLLVCKLFMEKRVLITLDRPFGCA